MSENERQVLQAFRAKAEQLAEVEACILQGADYAPSNPSGRGKKAASPNKLYTWLAVAAAGGLLTYLFGDGGALTLAFGAVCAVGLFKSYLEWNNYRANRAENAAESQLAKHVAGYESQRTQLLAQLNQMRKEHPALAGSYWWDANKNPAFDGKLLSGKVPVYGQWEYSLLSPAQLRQGEHGVYLENMQTYQIGVDGAEVRALLENQTGEYAVLYKNAALLSERARMYQIVKLYAVTMEPIEEIQATTTRTRVDKEAQMAAWQQKLDVFEMGKNALGSHALMTDQEMYLFGHKNLQDYAQDGLRRSVLESQVMQSINAKGDYEETTTYRTVFNDLYRLTLLPCADVYISLEEGSNGHAAAIAVSRAPQQPLRLILRTPKNVKFGGKLEAYGEHDAVELGEAAGKLSIQMAVDMLMNGDLRKTLRLNKRDVLAQRPQGLDDYEWAYLTWQDRE